VGLRPASVSQVVPCFTVAVSIKLDSKNPIILTIVIYIS